MYAKTGDYENAAGQYQRTINAYEKAILSYIKRILSVGSQNFRGHFSDFNKNYELTEIPEKNFLPFNPSPAFAVLSDC